MTIETYNIAIIKITPLLECDILDCVESEEKAIHLLTNHLNEEYNLKETTEYKIYQKSNVSFEVFKVGYLYKSLECKYHIVNLN